MKTLFKIVEQYKKLSTYCDTFWKKTAEKFPKEIACHAGCSICCELPSVNYLEAMIIARSGEQTPPAKPEKTEEKSQEGSCPFLCGNRCGIYASRPLICRTHGLLLKSKEFTDRVTITCPYNFSAIDLSTVDLDYALDIDKVTDNLARLNAAFCLLLGDIKKSEQRIALSDLAAGKINPLFFQSNRKNNK